MGVGNTACLEFAHVHFHASSIGLEACAPIIQYPEVCLTCDPNRDSWHESYRAVEQHLGISPFPLELHGHQWESFLFVRQPGTELNRGRIL
jgi:hypothetical protein